MPSMSPLSINDGAAVTHTFNPRGVDPSGNVATLVESSGVPLGDKRLTVSRSKTAQGREKAVFKFTIPIVLNATVDGITEPRVVRTSYANVEFSFDKGSNTAERTDVRSFVANLMVNALAGDTVDDLEYLF